MNENYISQGSSPAPNSTLIFSIMHVYSPFGFANDVIIEISDCPNLWGGVTVQAQSQTRLGMEDYQVNQEITASLYGYLKQFAYENDIEHSFVFCEGDKNPLTGV